MSKGLSCSPLIHTLELHHWSQALKTGRFKLAIKIHSHIEVKFLEKTCKGWSCTFKATQRSRLERTREATQIYGWWTPRKFTKYCIRFDCHQKVILSSGTLTILVREVDVKLGTWTTLNLTTIKSLVSFLSLSFLFYSFTCDYISIKVTCNFDYYITH